MLQNWNIILTTYEQTSQAKRKTLQVKLKNCGRDTKSYINTSVVESQNCAGDDLNDMTERLKWACFFILVEAAELLLPCGKNPDAPK